MTEFVPGEPLSARLPTQPFQGAELVTVLSGIGEALADIHRAGIIHRDLKPPNVMYGPDGVRVVDFGISLPVALDGPTDVVTGTPGWLSPEQATGIEVGTAPDIFNLGLLIAYFSAGRQPFGDRRPDAVLYRVVNSDPDLTGIPTPLRDLAAACLSKNPTGRLTAAHVVAIRVLVECAQTSVIGRKMRPFRRWAAIKCGQNVGKCTAREWRKPLHPSVYRGFWG